MVRGWHGAGGGGDVHLFLITASLYLEMQEGFIILPFHALHSVLSKVYYFFHSNEFVENNKWYIQNTIHILI